MEGQTTTTATAAQPVQPTPTTAAQTTQAVQQAVTVDMEAINKAAEARAERAAQTVVKDLLKQQGLDDASVKSMLDEWKAKQTTPELELKQRDETIETLQQQLESERQEKTALAKGIPLGTNDEAVKARVAACMTLAKTYVTDDVTFEAALDKALAIISFEEPATEPPAQAQKVPPMYGGAGRTPISTGMTKEDFAKLSYLDKVKFKQENPTIYEEIIKK